MKKITRSARGTIVDFDLIRIKQQMETAPKPTDVRARESFIDQKFKRRIKKLTQEVITPPIPPTTEPTPDPQDLDSTD